MYRLLFLVFLTLQYQSDAFNISPYPTQVINSPSHLKTYLNQTRSSYFGFSLVVRPSGIIVGAPRAQSTLESQRNINETGAIFKCSLTNGTCYPYVVDSRGNVKYKRVCPIFEGEGRDFQWLGGTMDGGTKDADKLIVCAPRFYAPTADEYYMNGVCYWLQNTNTNNPENVTRIAPLRSISMQVNKANVSYYYKMGELGLSAHVTDDNSKFLIGAPGIDTWRGSVILDDNPTVSPQLEDMNSKKCPPNDNQKKPQNWDQEKDSYFGYAVSSGYFDSLNPATLLYVATAPQANNRSGEAYIFDIQGEGIHKIYKFEGAQFGEYFGYSVLAEDLNSDGKTDVIFSAPLHSLDDSYDNGAIYVFINKGFFHFEMTIVKSPAGSKGRFGTTLSRLGDINHDGFNDIAVGAPFAGNGSVFIYLGGKLGLRDQPSQRLDAPAQQASKYGSHMFGHGLSRGSDIDGNGFNDFAIGAPNAEAVYLYRAYPVVKIHATIKPESREIKLGQEKVKITACFGLNTTAPKRGVQEQEVDFRITVDLNRARFDPANTNEMRFNATASLDEKCRHFYIKVRHNGHNFVAIELELHYELANKIPNSGEFCETCAIVDPADPKFSTEKIIFSTDCASDVCVPDLQISSKKVSSTYILGSSDTLRMIYKITNQGEKAYLPQFNVTSTSHLAFAQIPPNCKVVDAAMTCDLNHGRPLAKGQSLSITISFDTSQLSGQSLVIHAEVFSAGNERNPKDNKQANSIGLSEFTEIDVSGGPTNGLIVLNHYPYSAKIIDQYRIKSLGPSTIEQLTISFYIPVAYRPNNSMAIIPIMNITSLQTQATYDSQKLGINLYDQNNTLLHGYPLEKFTRKPRHLGREANDSISEVLTNELLVGSNRSIVLDCRQTNMTICVRAEMCVQLRPDKPINLNISFNVDLKEVKDPWEYFVILTNLKLLKKADPTAKSLKINRKMEPNVIYKPAELSIWIIIIAVVGGVLLLAFLTYALHKLGFFKRERGTKEVS
ncbi:integrin alpha-PS3-like isoform X1 [Drosophila gunungcola]|uniref:integrin alpha-PS3-like isoform X1 n=1 Tax=Drosophila gunungcola TaxID=103775 RepID=UPI0022E407E0|nr:integrin alpha-PS3-like isoform X1 [Drosophila gunungcola]